MYGCVEGGLLEGANRWYMYLTNAHIGAIVSRRMKSMRGMRKYSVSSLTGSSYILTNAQVLTRPESVMLVDKGHT